MPAEQNKNRVLPIFANCFCFVQVQGFSLNSAKNLFLPPGRAVSALPAKAIRKPHLFSGHHLRGLPNNACCLLKAILSTSRQGKVKQRNIESDNHGYDENADRLDPFFIDQCAHILCFTGDNKQGDNGKRKCEAQAHLA
jgi:hypothetical protein